ncbi:MAG: glycoside hydrolase family 11 protein [Chloroflexota bacterium]
MNTQPVSPHKGTRSGKNRARRFTYTTFVVVLCALTVFVSAALARTLTSNETGTDNGFFYSFWKDSGSATFELLEGGRYRSQWNNSTNNWVGGKGWKPGGPRTVNYTGYYGVDNSQNSYLALYGWTRNPLIEYYVIESYGSYNPATCNGGQDFGSFQSDGATYNVRRCQRVDAPCIDGDHCTFYQYFSVRSPKKGFGNISGTITVQNHFNYWASKGLNLGSHDYMIFATEGYQSSGSSDITVSEGPIAPTTPPSTGIPPTVPPGGRIEAENYSSSGGTLDVCGNMLCYIEANAWTQYNSISLPAGANRIDLSVANGGSSTSVQVWIGSTNVGTLAVSGTGGWDTFQTRSLTFPTQSGVQNVRLVFVNGNLNVDWLAFSGSGTNPTNTPPAPTNTPPVPTVPPGGRIEAENYSSSGGTLDVCGNMLCYIEANAWTQYNSISLPAGANRIDLSVANGGSSTSVQVWIGSTNVGTLAVSGTGGWDTFQTRSLTFPTQSGVQNVRLVFVNGNLNVDWLAFSGSGTNPTNTPPAPTNTPPVPTHIPTTSVPGSSCSVSYRQNDWGSGATVNVTISNNSVSAINGWTLGWTFPGNQQISSLWSGSYTQTGSSVSVSDAGWNGTIGANGGTASFGFNISYSGSNQAPTGFTLNGVPCQ